jgi:effector-binding domain-containing protein
VEKNLFELWEQLQADRHRILQAKGNGGIIMVTQPKLKNRQQQYYAAIRTQVPIPFGRYLQPLWKKVNDWLKSQGINSPRPAIIRYLTTDMSKKLDIDVGFEMDQRIAGDERIIVDVLPSGQYATLLYTGPYRGKGIFKANVAMMEWAKANGIVWNTSSKNGVEWWNGRVERYLVDPAREPDTKKYQAEVAIMVK